jgi:hypothetical protein
MQGLRYPQNIVRIVPAIGLGGDQSLVVAEVLKEVADPCLQSHSFATILRLAQYVDRGKVRNPFKDTPIHRPSSIIHHDDCRSPCIYQALDELI